MILFTGSQAAFCSSKGGRFWHPGKVHRVRQIEIGPTALGQSIIRKAWTLCGLEIEWPQLSDAVEVSCKRCAA